MNCVRSILYPLLGGFLCLNGCTLAPKYFRPEAPVPGDWPKGPAYEQNVQPEKAPLGADLKWQEFFTDENLRKVIATALTNNRDLRLAALNVKLARALYGIQRDALFPSVYASGTVSKEGSSRDLIEPGASRTSDHYSASLGVLSWEVDFFGRIQSLKDRALEEYFASEYAKRAAQILLISNVANAYLAFAADRENLTLAENTHQAHKATYEMVQRQYTLGITNELSLRQAQTQVETARRAVAVYTQQVAQDENALILLLGGAPLPAELLPAELGRIIPPKEVTAGVSSKILLSRPDVLQAEAMLKANNAEIGAARAAFFPTISLTSTLGTASNELSSLFESGRGTWSFVPHASMPIFDARTWSALKATKVQREIAVTEYERAIQNAFREVADALAVCGTINEQLAAQQALVDSLAEVYRLSLNRYEKGVDSYLSVLDAQRFLFSAQQTLILVRLASLTSQVKLYAVLGGGGETEEESSQSESL